MPLTLPQRACYNGWSALRLADHTFDFNLIYYDKAKFDEAGLAYPEPGWTWDDFRTLAN